MILLHGTGGVGYREHSWSGFLRDRGVATFVLDYFRPRNVSPTDRDIPQPPQDVWGALKVLASHPRVDTDRVAILGVSNGAAVSYISKGFTSTADTGGINPRAYFMLYGGCNRDIQRDDPDAAYRFFVGSADTLITPANCQRQQATGQRAGKDVRTIVFPGVHHGFDGNESRDFHHPRLGRMIIHPDRAATEETRKAVIETLKQVFGADRIRR